ncbi:MAG: thioredoxin family protein [Candidatus Heimdallarchaeum aukensis]|uniref:Thioredoxin family protein n=1 Tax=Candidatus Heimdallarchaeum aukensis TaxID=2876573 RepID=A0A9Y1FM43_9ARCH|nr:MAG: thioredoxin family protein [Candidatus Heimdallarchaeum aukensis]
MSDKKTIKVIGAGCKKCKLQLDYVKEALAKLNKEDEYEIKYITNVDEIVEEDVFLTPAVKIDNETINEGKVIGINKLVKIL